MKVLIVSILFCFRVLAFDDNSVNHSGVYKVVAVEACVAYGLSSKCVKSKKTEIEGRSIQIFHAGEKKTPSMCTIRNFNEGIFNQKQFCYFKDETFRVNLTVSGGGFRGQLNERESQTYSNFRQTGDGYELIEGVTSRGFSLFYIYKLAK